MAATHFHQPNVGTSVRLGTEELRHWVAEINLLGITVISEIYRRNIESSHHIMIFVDKAVTAELRSVSSGPRSNSSFLQLTMWSPDQGEILQGLRRPLLRVSIGKMELVEIPTIFSQVYYIFQRCSFT